MARQLEPTLHHSAADAIIRFSQCCDPRLTALPVHTSSIFRFAPPPSCGFPEFDLILTLLFGWVLLKSLKFTVQSREKKELN